MPFIKILKLLLGKKLIEHLKSLSKNNNWCGIRWITQSSNKNAKKLYDKIWQAFCVLLPIRTVGVMGDNRTYDYVICLRMVTSLDGMTADWYSLPDDILKLCSSRIVNEVDGVNRVVLDITSKPPGTIEWE